MGSDEAASLGVRNFFQVAVNQIFQVAITSWPCLASAQEFMSQFMNSCAFARQGQLVNELQALAGRQSRGLQAAAGIMSLALHNALSSQC